MQRFEHVGVAKEVRDADEHVAVEQVELRWIIADPFQVRGQRLHFGDGHAPAHSPFDRVRLVVREIVVMLLVQEREQRGHVLFRQMGRLIVTRSTFDVARDTDDLIRDGRGRENEIDGTGSDGVFRHPVEARALILREHDSSPVLDGARAERPVARRPRQHHPDRATPLILGQAIEESVDQH